MSQAVFLRKLTERLTRLGIDYMLVGSSSSSIHGEPRSTNDIDVVVKLSPAQLDRLVAEFSVDSYVSAAAAREALRNQTMFNVVDYETGWKADLIVLKRAPYDIEEFHRRISATYQGVEVYCATPEDVILSKLRWLGMTSSERQKKDALSVAQVCWNELDFSYLNRWAAELGIEALLAEVLQEAEKLKPPDDLPF
jgi:hypothetical protein